MHAMSALSLAVRSVSWSGSLSRSLPLILIPAALFALPASAKLPPPTPEAKAAADETAAKNAWNDKISAYQTCRAADRAAESYRAGAKAAGKEPPAPQPAPACTDPGVYVSQVTPVTSKPLEAAGAHSPPGKATSPPNTAVPAAQLPPTK